MYRGGQVARGLGTHGRHVQRHQLERSGALEGVIFISFFLWRTWMDSPTSVIMDPRRI